MNSFVKIIENTLATNTINNLSFPDSNKIQIRLKTREQLEHFIDAGFEIQEKFFNHNGKKLFYFYVEVEESDILALKK